MVSPKGKQDNVQKQTENKQATAQSCSYQNIQAYQTGINSSLKTKEVLQKYHDVASKLEPESRVALSKLLKSGVLLNDKSNDGSSVLDNLHKIVTEPRIKGLNSARIAGEAITAISNPRIITQHFGDIPENISKAVLQHPELGVRAQKDMGIGGNSSSCVAASIEFNLAQKNPAEFVRMAAGLSSENFSVTKEIPLSAIANTKESAVWLLDKFNLPYALGENNSAKVKIQPDRNAIIRARVQTSYKDPGERSVVDVLMQSALMNTGSQNTYNSLTDTRENTLFNPQNNKGLSMFEMNFMESVVSGKSKQVTMYHNLDETGKIVSQSCDAETMEKQIAATLEAGENVIIGIVETNAQGQIVNGHEMTITNIYSNQNGDTVFACNDTADDSDEPYYVLAKNIIPQINHALINKEAVGNMDVPKTEDWIEFYKQYITA